MRRGYTILSGRDLEEMRAACRLAADTLLLVGEHLQPGMTTLEIDTLVHEHTVAAGARPGPLGYRGFPRSVCTSVNEVVCHGIPGPRVLCDGDIVNVDVTPVLPADGGWYGDTSATFYVGEPSPLARHVTEVARTCLELGISQVRPGARVGDIGAAIQAFAESRGCSVVRDYTGHGVGRVFHGPPTITHYGVRGTGPELVRGLVFTIEPMINAGGPKVAHLEDGWTVVTRDRAPSAQFEHTVVVTDDGCEVLTRRPALLRNSEDKPWVQIGARSGPSGAYRLAQRSR